MFSKCSLLAACTRYLQTVFNSTRLNSQTVIADQNWDMKEMKGASLSSLGIPDVAKLRISFFSKYSFGFSPQEDISMC